jgi:hypothetical protein
MRLHKECMNISFSSLTPDRDLDIAKEVLILTAFYAISLQVLYGASRKNYDSDMRTQEEFLSR